MSATSRPPISAATKPSGDAALPDVWVARDEHGASEVFDTANEARGYLRAAKESGFPDAKLDRYIPAARADALHAALRDIVALLDQRRQEVPLRDKPRIEAARALLAAPKEGS